MRAKVLSLILVFLLLFSVPIYGGESKPLQKITVSESSINLNKGFTKSLKVSYFPSDTTDRKAVIWTSSDNSVASVVAGRVTGKGPGTCYITARCGSKTATCKVTVKAPVRWIELDITKKTIPVGGNFGITVSYFPGNTTDYKKASWTSSNTKVATVKGGRVYGHKEGKAIITAKMGTKTASCEVTVKYVAPKYVSVSEAYKIADGYRVKAGYKRYVRDRKLEEIAKVRAKELAERIKKYGKTAFEHETCYVYSNGKFIKQSAVRGSCALIKDVQGNVYRGENIAYGHSDCKEVMTAWYNSSGHKKNMLKKQHTKIGIAGYKFENKIYWVMVLSS